MTRFTKAYEAERAALVAQGLKLWLGEAAEGPCPTDAPTDSQGYRWIPNPYRSFDVRAYLRSHR